MEISRLNASEAYEQSVSSYGVVAFWAAGEAEADIRNNQRAAFVFGLARGRDIPALLIAHQNDRLPLDLLDDVAERWREPTDFARIIRQFRDRVADLQVEFVK